MILNRESTRKDEKRISKDWVIIYFDKTILVLTLLRPSSSVRVVFESLGQVVVRPSVSGPPLGPAIRSEYSSSRPSAFCFASDLSSGTALPDHPSTFVSLSRPPLGASDRTPSTSALPPCSAGPPPSDVTGHHSGSRPATTESPVLFPDHQVRPPVSVFFQSDYAFRPPAYPTPSSVYPDRRFRPPPSRNPLLPCRKSAFTQSAGAFRFPPPDHHLLLQCSTVNSLLPSVKVDNHGSSPRHCANEAHISW
jgi:hypothetical protein